VLTVLLGFGTAVGYAMHDFLMVKVVRAASVWTGLTWSMGVALAVLLPLALILDGLPGGSAEWQAVGIAVASGLAEAAGLACLLRGLVVGRLSLVTPLASLSGGLVAAIMVAGGESLSTAALVGLPLAVAGGLLASIERVPKEEVFGPDPAKAVPAENDPSPALAGDAPPPAGAQAPLPGRTRRRRTRATAGAGWALASSALFGVTMLLLAAATALHPVAIAAYGRLGTMAVLVPVALMVSGLRLPRPLAKRAAAAGCFDAGAFVALATAITIGPVAVASVLASLGGLVAAVLGFVVLRERLSAVQYAGVGLTCVAVAFLAAG
jgi:drug/metabolite transporter (DMT)-like permease